MVANAAADVFMPFGKWKGYALHDVPTDYLLWALEQCTNLSTWLRRAMVGELEGRGHRQPIGASAPLWKEILQRWKREMALRFHPDRGGSLEAMVAINVASDRLQQMIEEARDD